MGVLLGHICTFFLLMATINLCRWLTFQQARRYYGWNLAQRLEDRELRDEIREWSLRDNQNAVGEWAFTWLLFAGIAVVPVSWAILQWAPSIFAGFMVLLLVGPIAGVLSLLEIYIRWLIGWVFPGSPLGLPNGPSILEGKSLLVSSLITYAVLPFLYIFLDAIFLPALRN